MSALKTKLTQEQKSLLYSELLDTIIKFAKGNYPLLTTKETEELVKEFSVFLHSFMESAEKEKHEAHVS